MRRFRVCCRPVWEIFDRPLTELPLGYDSRAAPRLWRSGSLGASSLRLSTVASFLTCGWHARRRLPCAAGGNRHCMADGDIHVVKSGNDWAVKIEGIKGALLSFDTEDDAVQAARHVAEAARCEVVVHARVPLPDQPAASSRGA